MRHPKAVEWERKLKKVFDEIDTYVEETYAKKYPLHPARARYRTTSNPEHDGLFSVGAAFSAGFGSKYGPGYIVDVHMVTLSDIPEEVRETIEKEVVAKLREELPRMFPGRNLKVERDGPVFKIYGDLSLGKV